MKEGLGCTLFFGGGICWALALLSGTDHSFAAWFIVGLVAIIAGVVLMGDFD